MQAFRPSNHLCFTFLLPVPPQFLNQAPPGAQQLTRPDFSNVPHFGHVLVFVIVGMTDGVLIVVLVMSSRSGFGRRDTYGRVPCVLVIACFAEVHTICDNDPDEPSNMSVLLALDRTQAAPQSACLKAAAKRNILDMVITLDTSHFEMSPLNDLARANI